MIRIEPDTFYTKDDLETLLQGSGVSAQTFLSRIKPKRVLRMLWKGSDLLTAWDRASEIGQVEGRISSPKNRGGRKSRKVGVIGGVFSLEELGLSREQ